MNKLLLIVLLLLISLVGKTQTESDRKTNTGLEKKLQLESPVHFYLMPMLPDWQQPLFINKPLFTLPRYSSLSISETMPNTVDFGFQEAKYATIVKNLSIYFSKKDETYSGMGSVYVAQASLVWKVNKKLTAKGGVFINKHITPMDLPPFMSHGFSSLLQYSFTKKIQLNIYGNYLNYNPEDPYTNMNSLFTQTKVGSNITFIKDESHKIGIGMDHQFNVSTKDWEPVYGTKITYKFPSR